MSVIRSQTSDVQFLVSRTRNDSTPKMTRRHNCSHWLCDDEFHHRVNVKLRRTYLLGIALYQALTRLMAMVHTKTISLPSNRGIRVQLAV